MLPTTLASFLVPLTSLFTGHNSRPPLASPPSLSFELRHSHIVSPEAHVYFADIPAETRVATAAQPNEHMQIATRPIRSFKPSSFDAVAAARLHSMRFGQSQRLSWDEDEVLAPDHESRETLLLLAKMANNAYVLPGDQYWYDLGGGWNTVRASAFLRRLFVT